MRVNAHRVIRQAVCAAASNTNSRSRGAVRPSPAIEMPLRTIERAQGMPGEGLTHGPPATKKQAAVTTGSADHPAFPARWFYGCFVLSPVHRAFWPPYRDNTLARVALGISVGMPRPHDLTVRASPSRLLKPSRPPHPRLAYRDDRAYAPLVEAG